MKKLTLLCLALFLLLTTACGSQSATENKKIPNHKIVSQSRNMDRLNVIAIVDEKITKQDMDNLAEKIVYDAKKTNSKLYGIYINITDTDIDGIPYTLGQYEYGPDGSASFDVKKIDAAKTLKNKSAKLNRDWSKKPTEKEYKLYIMYTDYLAKNHGKTSIANFLDQYKGEKPTLQQAEDSIKKVELWMIGGN